MSHTQEKKKRQSILTISEELQIINLANKYFKASVTHMFAELEKTMLKGSKESMTQ